MMSKPANCPADVRFVSEINAASEAFNPFAADIIPKVKETAKYPSAIGIPA